MICKFCHKKTKPGKIVGWYFADTQREEQLQQYACDDCNTMFLCDMKDSLAAFYIIPPYKNEKYMIILGRDNKTLILSRRNYSKNPVKSGIVFGSSNEYVYYIMIKELDYLLDSLTPKNAISKIQTILVFS